MKNMKDDLIEVMLQFCLIIVIVKLLLITIEMYEFGNLNFNE